VLFRSKVSVVIKSMSLRQALDAVCAVAGCRWELVEGPPVRRLRIPPAPSRRVRVSDASGPSAQKAAPATAERIYEPNEPGVTLPVLLSERKPQYTAEAMRARIQGLVKLAAVVRPDGAVGDVWVVQSLDRVYGLDDEAMKALRQWRFTPGTKDGHPVAVRVELEMQFTLAPR
jgi:TonB family protein